MFSMIHDHVDVIILLAFKPVNIPELLLFPVADYFFGTHDSKIKVTGELGGFAR
jgi:hypothetical protein